MSAFCSISQALRTQTQILQNKNDELNREVAERHQAKSQLQLQMAALNAAANIVIITDSKSSLLWVNDAFVKSSGYTFAEAMGQNPRFLKSGQHSREFYTDMWDTIHAGGVWHGIMQNKRKDGTLFDEEATFTPVKDAQGMITHFIAIKQDFTERKRAAVEHARLAAVPSLFAERADACTHAQGGGNISLLAQYADSFARFVTDCISVASGH